MITVGETNEGDISVTYIILLYDVAVFDKMLNN